MSGWDWREEYRRQHGREPEAAAPTIVKPADGGKSMIGGLVLAAESYERPDGVRMVAIAPHVFVNERYLEGAGNG